MHQQLSCSGLFLLQELTGSRHQATLALVALDYIGEDRQFDLLWLVLGPASPLPLRRCHPRPAALGLPRPAPRSPRRSSSGPRGARRWACPRPLLGLFGSRKLLVLLVRRVSGGDLRCAIWLSGT